MLRTASSTLRFALAASLISALLASAQTAPEVPQAPVPTQIASAKKVFISNASGEELDPRSFYLPTIDRDQAYAKFFAALKSGDRFEPVLVPADADLVLEIRFMFKLAPGDGTISPYLRLLIVDPKTHTLLWALSERVEASAGIHGREKREKNFDQAITALVGDLTRLASQPMAPPAGPR